RVSAGPRNASFAWRHRDAGSLRQGHDVINLDALPLLLEPIRPADVHALDLRGLSQAEMHAQIVLRKIAAAAADFLELHSAATEEPDACANCASVRSRAHELERHPTRIRGRIEAKEVRGRVHVVDDD